MANDGVDVSVPDQLPLGGAEPLSDRRLQVGQPGHHDSDRPSRIYSGLPQNDIADVFEKIDCTEAYRKRKAEEEIRSGPGGKG